LKSTKRHLWTDNVVVSPIDLIPQTRECLAVTHALTSRTLPARGARTHSFRSFPTTVMSMFGRGSSAPSGAVNTERVEMAIQECVLMPFTTCVISDLTAQVGHVHRYFQPPCLASVLTGNPVSCHSCPHFRTCHTKCVNTRYTEGELTKGESVCIDRCVAKFFEANKKVGERLQSLGANAGTTGTFGL
jgi:mitochondrial import inner membrane translocase subunit TIM10